MAGGSPSATITTLFAKLRVLLQGYQLLDFAIYTVDGEEARLTFSSGAVSHEGAAPSEFLALSRLPSLRQFLAGDQPVCFRLEDNGDGTVPGLFLELPGVTAIFPLLTTSGAIGFILGYGPITPQLGEPESLEELTRLISFFAGQLARQRAEESLFRKYQRLHSQLRELQEGLLVLQLSDEAALLSAVLERALTVLASQAGMLWLRRSGAWYCAQVNGLEPVGIRPAVERLLDRCLETGKAGLISSLSDEETWEFDVETIHIASLAVFPLRAGAKIIGGIVAFDATVSSDVVDVLEGTTLVGGTAIEAWQNAQRMLEQQRLEEQLALAARAQQRLLPAQRIELPGVQVAHFSQYCDETGGDYLDAIPCGEPLRCAFAVGDVSGHGLGAAMLMVDVRARLRTRLEGGAFWSPDQVLADLNRALCQEVQAAEFVTLFLCLLDTRTGILSWASAGHEPPAVYKAREDHWVELGSTGLPLGIQATADYGLETIRLEAEDLVIFATDGATEAIGGDGEVFGAQGVRRAAEAHAEAEAADILAAIVEATLAHHDARPFVDDVTYLVVKIDRIVLRLLSAAPEMEDEPMWVERFACSREAKDQRLTVMRRVLEELYSDFDLSEVLFSVDEALTNAILHGNREVADQAIEVKLWCDGDEVVFHIEHQGEAFDPLQNLPGQIDREQLRRESGRGLLIITSMMDEVVYWNEGRGVGLRKRLRHPGAGYEQLTNPAPGPQSLR